jgi:hypothetical protein
MIDFNTDTLNKVIRTAKRNAVGTPWINAINRAAIELTTNPYIEIAGDHLLIGSPSGNSYSVNGSCQCDAYQHNKKPCWHRACKQLVARYNEAEQRKAAAAAALASINELF